MRFWGNAALLESSASFERTPGRSQRRRTTIDLASEEGRAAATASAYRAYRQQRYLDADQRRTLDRVALAGLLAPVHADTFADEPASLSTDPPPLTYLPVGIPTVLSGEDFDGPLVDGDDDLAAYLIDPFLDERLRGLTGASLLSAAWDLAYVQERQLRGLHSLMTVDPVALLSIPDAVHRPWALRRLPASTPASATGSGPARR